MTTKAKEKQEQEKRPLNKYYRSIRHISWIEIIPKYITPREAAALSTEEKQGESSTSSGPGYQTEDDILLCIATIAVDTIKDHSTGSSTRDK
jgi:hypothetical protein